MGWPRAGWPEHHHDDQGRKRGDKYSSGAHRILLSAGPVGSNRPIAADALREPGGG